MALIGDVKVICDDLAAKGWRRLLLDVTQNALDIQQPSADALKAELGKSLPSIKRQHPGLEDFHRNANQAIAPGSPARSLLYHVLASPQVLLPAAATPDAYPTLGQLDTIENYIYSLVADQVDLTDTFVAVFAYQYREAGRTTHRCHADFAYSRTGVSRVGTAGHRYDAAARSFQPVPDNGKGIAVLPARYGAFLAKRGRPGAAGSVQMVPGQPENHRFAFPVHKLFPGGECLEGKNITLEFLEFHRNEKLRMTHQLSEAEGGLPLPPGFNVKLPPYVRDTGNGANLVSPLRVGASVLIVPTPAESLVRTAVQHNSISGKDEMVYFEVPELMLVPRPGKDRPSRFVDSSLEISGYVVNNRSWRMAPEFVNIRHRVDTTLPADQVPTDLNTLPENEYTELLRSGGYPAAHFIDDSCDGCVEVKVGGLANQTRNLAAFSLVTAPDFFPLADQMELQFQFDLRDVGPLSFERTAPNPGLPLPSKRTQPAFERSDLTVTAIVGNPATGTPVNPLGQANRSISYLPDGASGVFAPGWDISKSRDADGFFFTSYGLGSPFPEDAKLCAALSSFWPAVAPDASRTFGNRWPDRLPMLDEELGFHPGHPRVKSGEQQAYRGWDGEFGPYFERLAAGEFVNHASIERSDYVKNALEGRFRVDLTASVQSEDLIDRFRALKTCLGLIEVQEENVCLVEVRKVPAWSTFPAAPGQLQGGGYLMVFAEVDAPEATGDLTRLRSRVLRRHTFQLAANGTAYQRGTGQPVLHPA